MPQVQDRRVANRAYELRPNCLGELCRDFLARRRALLAALHLYELVGLERGTRGHDHTIDDAVLTEEHERLKVMRERTQVTALLPGQCWLLIHERSIQCRGSAHKREAALAVRSTHNRDPGELPLFPTSTIIDR